MNDHSFEIVRFALALHLEIVPEAIVEGDSLSEDLGLDPLDLVLIVLRLGSSPRPSSRSPLSSTRTRSPISSRSFAAGWTGTAAMR